VPLAPQTAGRAPRSDHTLYTLALFEGPRCAPGGDRSGDLAAGHLDNALLLASSLAPDADDVLVMYASLTPRARDEIVVSMGQYVLEASVCQAPETPAEAMAIIKAFQRTGGSIAFGDASFDVETPTPVASLAVSDQADSATLKNFSRRCALRSRTSPPLREERGARTGIPASSSSPGRQSMGRCRPTMLCGTSASEPRRSPSSAPWRAAPQRAPAQESACSRWPKSCASGL
jgi:hypothetical protein